MVLPREGFEGLLKDFLCLERKIQSCCPHSLLSPSPSPGPPPPLPTFITVLIIITNQPLSLLQSGNFLHRKLRWARLSSLNPTLSLTCTPQRVKLWLECMLLLPQTVSSPVGGGAREPRGCLSVLRICKWPLDKQNLKGTCVCPCRGPAELFPLLHSLCLRRTPRFALLSLQYSRSLEKQHVAGHCPERSASSRARGKEQKNQQSGGTGYGAIPRLAPSQYFYVFLEKLI